VVNPSSSSSSSSSRKCEIPGFNGGEESSRGVPEHGGSMDLQNGGVLPQHHTMSQLRRLQLSNKVRVFENIHHAA